MDIPLMECGAIECRFPLFRWYAAVLGVNQCSTAQLEQPRYITQ